MSCLKIFAQKPKGSAKRNPTAEPKAGRKRLASNVKGKPFHSLVGKFPEPSNKKTAQRLFYF